MSLNAWTAVGNASDIPVLEGRSVRFGPGRVAIFRLADGWAAIDHGCPHAGGPLADGLVADACVTCPLHGWRFDLHTGEQVGSKPGPGVRIYEVREREGLLELRVPEQNELPRAA